MATADDGGVSDDTVDPVGDGRADRRSFLQKLAGFTGGALGFLSFPGPARAVDEPWTPPTGPEAGSRAAGDFPKCDPFGQYSDGKDCTIGFTCGELGFHCAGGVLDDYECTGLFACTAFLCTYSYDDQDCEEACNFHCSAQGEFECREGYN